MNKHKHAAHRQARHAHHAEARDLQAKANAGLPIADITQDTVPANHKLPADDKPPAPRPFISIADLLARTTAAVRMNYNR